MAHAQDPLLFAPPANGEFAQAVAAALGIALAPLEERVFEDGEYKLRPLVSVRGRDVYLLQGLAADAEQSVDDKLCRLLFATGALHDASAASVTVVLPYLCYARKDRRTKPRDPLTTRYLAQMLEAVGASRVVVLDAHNQAAFENAFRCQTEHLEAAPLFVQWLRRALAGRPLALISPDAGGIKRMERYRRACTASPGLDVSTGFMEKYRSGGVVSGRMLVGDVSGRTAVIVDDMISSGTTMVRAAEACRAHGATAVYALATHGLFAGSANRVLADPVLDGVVVSDSVPGGPVEGELARKLTRLSVTPLLAEAVRRLHRGESLTALREDGPAEA